MKRDDQKWFEDVVERFQTPLISYALRFVKNTEKAREIVQDTFMKLCEQNPQKIDSYLAPWLYSVCRNQAIDVMRKSGREEGSVSLQEQTVPDSHQQEPNDQNNQKILHSFLKTLSDKQQEIVRLKFQHDLSYSEISSITHLSISHVGVILHEAIQKLRGIYTKKGGVSA